MGIENRHRRGLARRWFPLLATIAALAAVALLDAHLKNPTGSGYCPPDASLMLAVDDFPGLWSECAASDELMAIREAWHPPARDLELAVRRTTGIRPTPTRWRLWMGSRVLAAHSPHGWGFCARPGLLLRAADLVVSTRLPDGGDGRVRASGDLYYAWRDGFVIVSASRDYVESALRAPSAEPPPGRAPTEVRVAWDGPRRGVLRARVTRGLPVSGWVAQPLTHGASALTLADAWPASPLVAVAVSHADNLVALWRLAESGLRGRPHWDEIRRFAAHVWARWNLGPVPADWAGRDREWAVALTGVALGEGLPVPLLAGVISEDDARIEAHPLASFASTLVSAPHEWRGAAGLVARRVCLRLEM